MGVVSSQTEVFLPHWGSCGWFIYFPRFEVEVLHVVDLLDRAYGGDGATGRQSHG